MSILEQVKQAESFVEEQKTQALEEVRKKQEQLKQETANAIQQLFANIEKQELKLDELVAHDMEKISDKIKTSYETDDALVLEMANKKIDKAVNHVIKKVFAK